MTLAVHVLEKMHRRSLAADIALILAGSLLIAGSAQVRFYLPNTPVPITLQTLAVLLIGAAYGSWRGMAAVVTYLAAGSLGLPFFAGLKGGAIALLGPTGGYLAGFVLAAGLVGWLAEHKFDRTVAGALPMFLGGQLVIYLCGVLWLAQFVGGFAPAVATGILPFIAGDLVKISFAMLALPLVRRWIR